MAAEFLRSSIDSTRSRSIEEFAQVRLLYGVLTDDGIMVPLGTEGTVVGIWAKGAAYEVEFDLGLATVEASKLEATTSHS